MDLFSKESMTIFSPILILVLVAWVINRKMPKNDTKGDFITMGVRG